MKRLFTAAFAISTLFAQLAPSEAEGAKAGGSAGVAGPVISWGETATPGSTPANLVVIAAGDSHNLALKQDGSIVQSEPEIF